MVKQYGFYVDTEKCTGCKTCQLACKDYKNLDVDVNFRRVYEYTGGDWVMHDACWTPTNLFAYYLSIACNHCETPSCASVCPTGAMHKNEEGFVVVNEKVCIGCRNCENACPYGAPQYNPRKKHMTKCDGCHERVRTGLKPICVESCPLRALDFGLLSDMQAKYGTVRDVAPLPPSHYTSPGLVLKLNTHAKPTGYKGGFLANPQEV